MVSATKASAFSMATWSLWILAGLRPCSGAPGENRGVGCALVQLDVIHGSFVSGELALHVALRVRFDRRARLR